MPTSSGYTLVLDLTFVSERSTSHFTQVLLDGGRSINILYYDTTTSWSPSSSRLRWCFHGIMPGHSCPLIGMVRFDVLFGTSKNFCREPMRFEVVDFFIPYQGLRGWPTLAKFMAVPHYASSR